MMGRHATWRTALIAGDRLTRVRNISMLGLFSIGLAACSSGDHSQDVAKGTAFSVSRGELDQALQALPALPKEMQQSARRNVLSRVIQEKLLANAAVSEGLDRDPRVLAQVEAAKRAALAQAYAAKLTSSVLAPSDADIKTFYDQHPDAFSQRVSVEMNEVIFVGPQQMATKFATQLDGGTPIVQLRAAAAAAGVHVTGGHVVTTSDKLPTVLAQHIAHVAVGTNVIFPVEDGVIFARVLAISPAPLDLGQATATIRDGIQVMSKNNLLNKEIARLRSNADIKYPDPTLALPAKP